MGRINPIVRIKPGGPKGETGTSFIWKGNYNGSTSYVKNDVVAYLGSSYINTVPCIGVLPTQTSNWDVFAVNSSNNSFISNEIPSGSINGSNVTFTLANTPVVGTLALYLNGQRLNYTEDFTLSTATITMVIAPSAGDLLTVDYLLAGIVSSNADTLDNAHLSIDGTLASNSDGKVPSEKAVRTWSPQTGWYVISATLTYSASDAPTYTASTSIDLTGIISVGMKIKLTQTTDKFFFVTAITSNLITLYGGTDYTLINAAITNPYFSIQKAPLNFPLNPTKWTVELSMTSDNLQSNPVQNTWYNLGSNIVIPIGVWNIEYFAQIYGGRGTNGGVYLKVTLSSANNSEDNTSLTAYTQLSTTATGLSALDTSITAYRRSVLVLTSKTTKYLNLMTSTTSISAIYILGTTNYSPTVVRAVCAYL